MANKENEKLKEELTHKFDSFFAKKARLEKKVTGYLAIAALLLGQVLQMLTTDKIISTDMFRVFCGLTFGLSFILVVICAIILFPREIRLFPSEWISDFDKIRTTLSENEFKHKFHNMEHECLEKNNTLIIGLTRYNKIASIVMLLTLAVFSLDCILFFVLLG